MDPKHPLLSCIWPDDWSVLQPPVGESLGNKSGEERRLIDNSFCVEYARTIRSSPSRVV